MFEVLILTFGKMWTEARRCWTSLEGIYIVSCIFIWLISQMVQCCVQGKMGSFNQHLSCHSVAVTAVPAASCVANVSELHLVPWG